MAEMNHVSEPASHPRPSLAVDLPGLALPTPVVVASGCFSPELGHLVDVRKLGGIVSRTVTLRPRKGSLTPRMVETPSGLLFDSGGQNPGLEGFAAEEMPALAKTGVPVLASIAGSTVEELIRLTMSLDVAEGVAGFEANACWPSRDRDRKWFASTPEGAAEVAGAVARLTRLPVFVKLSVEVEDLPAVAGAVMSAGATGVTLIHSLSGMAFDPEAGSPRLASGSGGLSGPAIRPVAVAAVHRVATAHPEVPIMGVGGVATAEDALEMLAAGAWAVQMGTAVLANPSAPIDAAAGILRHLEANGMGSVAEFRRRPVPSVSEPGEEQEMPEPVGETP